MYNQSQLQILMGLVFFVPLRAQFAENANESYHVYKVIVYQILSSIF